MTVSVQSRRARAALVAAAAALSLPVLAAPALAQAPAAAGGPTSMLLFIGQLALVFIIMYFLLIRPQQKRAQEVKKMQDNLQKGDKVVTQGGMFGTVVNVSADRAIVKVDDNTKIEFQRSAIVAVLSDKK
jgi:preprotein translocase subunit YajC